MNDLESMLSYEVIYFEKFRNVIQRTETEASKYLSPTIANIFIIIAAIRPYQNWRLFKANFSIHCIVHYNSQYLK